MKPRRQAVVKGSSLPVLRIVVRDGDARTLRDDLLDAIENARPLLAEAIAVLDLREREPGDVDPADIADAVRAGGVRLAAILIGEPAQRAALARLDLPIIEAPLSARQAADRGATEGSAAADPAPASRVDSNAGSPAATQPSASVEPPATEAPAAHDLAPLYLTRPLRSGQRFYAQGRDVVVAAPTSRGSELIADGSIYAFSPIRGRALAGASGDTTACIVATHLDAELVAVAGLYRTLERDDLKDHGDGPVSVRLWRDPEGNERLSLEAFPHSTSPQGR